MQKGCFQILSVKYVSNLMAFLTTFMGILRFFFFFAALQKLSTTV